MADAPYCNVDIASPKADPHKVGGLQLIPKGATLQQAITIINNNFNNIMKGNFVEDRTKRQTILTRIFDPADGSVYVDVRQIVGTVWVNGTTGQTVTWRQ